MTTLNCFTCLIDRDEPGETPATTFYNGTAFCTTCAQTHANNAGLADKFNA